MNSSERIIDILMSMLRGERIDIDTSKSLYGVSERTIKRDLGTIRNNEKFASKYVMHYNSVQKNYNVTSIGMIKPEEVLAILKILISSRALSKSELKDVTQHFLELVATEDRAPIKLLISTTSENYIPAVDNPIFPHVKEFAEWIIAKKEISFMYNDNIASDEITKKQTGVPLSMYFDNHHFYVMMYLTEQDKTSLYRLDRFQKIKADGKTINVPADKKPDVGRMINKTFLLNGGNHIHYKFRYASGKQVALDNVPNSYLSDDNDSSNPNATIVEGELFSQGALLWVLSQGAQVKVLGPQSLIEKLRTELKKTLELYPE